MKSVQRFICGSAKYAGFIFFLLVFAFSVWAEEKKAAGTNGAKYQTVPGGEGNVTEIIQRIQELEEEIRGYRKFIQEAIKNKSTLGGEIEILDAKIDKTELEIERVNLLIQETEEEIRAKQEEIARLKEKIKNERDYLRGLLRTLYEKEEVGLVEILLSSDSFSEFFGDLSNVSSVQGAIQKTLVEVKRLRDELQEEERALRGERNMQLEYKGLVMVQKGSLEVAKEEKERLLRETRGREAEYQKRLSFSSNDLSRIRKELYQLTGFGISIQFEEAFARVGPVADKTGVRAALLLAILKKESDWGLNVGRGVWYNDMHPRDWDAFLVITKKLGLDPDTTPVSAKPDYGWGGAMGPAQFLPSTWISYEERVAQVTGHNPPSPWDLDDALAAAGIKLAAAGADSQKFEDEWRASMIYFAGSNWENPAFGFYGDSVLDLANFYQEQINILSEGG